MVDILQCNALYGCGVLAFLDKFYSAIKLTQGFSQTDGLSLAHLGKGSIQAHSKNWDKTFFFIP